MHDVAVTRELLQLEGVEFTEVRDLVERYIAGEFTPTEFRSVCWQRAYDNAIDKSWRPISDLAWSPCGARLSL